ncbi:MAG: PepSY domain-containing protein [Burkholderiales bacterium]|nr:PepSY domain-containing protein [Burkholderiales bacterium]
MKRRDAKLRRAVLASALALAVGVGAWPALAADECDAPAARWQSREAVRKMAALRGWQVQRLKIDDGCYELRGVDAEGRAFKARIDPETLEVLRMQTRARDGDGHRKRERGGPGAHGAAPANESFPAGASS